MQGQARPEPAAGGSPLRVAQYKRHLDMKITKGPPLDDNSTRKSLKSVDFASDDDSQFSVHSDNISTTPLKLIVSRTSTTNPPSILSGENHNDNSSYVASTAETSIAPSIHPPLSPGQFHLARSGDRERERDSELIITLASSSRRTRRRSIDTNCSMAGIPPASIMERLTVTPAPRTDDE